MLFALILGLIGAVAAMYPARSAHNQWSHCNGGNNVFADQETANLYTGIAGRFFTHQPALNVNTQYSASHLYAFRDGGGTFVEVGLVRGIRDGTVYSGSTYYTASAEPGVLYDEVEFETAPAGYVNYKVANIGFNDVTGKWKWGVYFSDFATPRRTWELAAMNWAQA